MNIQRLDHVALVSSNSIVSKEWYQRILEMEWVYQGQWDNNPYFLKKGDAYIAIFQKGKKNSESNKDGVRIDHFAFRVDSHNDFEKAKTGLIGKGIAFEEEDHEISKSIYFKDPDQITVEITTYDC